MAYVVWPLAVVERFSLREGVSSWYRFHLRQALWFGNAAVLAGFVALLWPLALTAALASVAAILWIYGVALAIDFALFFTWLALALRYSRAAARGAFFAVPWLTRMTGSTRLAP